VDRWLASTRLPRTAFAAATGGSLIVLVLLASITAGAAAKPRPAPPTGLRCLSGKWLSNGIRTRNLSGLANALLTITASRGHDYDIAETDYEHATAIVVVIPHAVAPHNTGRLVVTGLSFARVFYLGHGHYRFTPGFSSEEVTLYSGRQKLVGPTSAKHDGGFTDLSCSAASLSAKLTVPGASGGQTMVSTFRRTR
jgi:hypothetical protein